MEPRAWSGWTVVASVVDDGKASTVSSDQSWVSTLLPGFDVVMRNPPFRCHIGCCSYGSVEVTVLGPVTVSPVQTSCHSPGGTQVSREVTFWLLSQIGATKVSFRWMYLQVKNGRKNVKSVPRRPILSADRTRQRLRMRT